MKWLAFAALWIVSNIALSGTNDAIHTCYDKTIQPSHTALDSDIVVAIDQTTLLDPHLKQSVADNIKPFLEANMGFTIITFSAFTQGHYTEVVTSGKLDAPLDINKRNDIPKLALAKFDQCFSHQSQEAAQIVGAALRNAYNGTSGEIAKSDVLASIKSISTLVANSKARNKVVLIVSDLLENSSISSFYADKGLSVRKIDPQRELKLVEDNQLFGDFQGARLYVIGTGILAEDAKATKSYRDPIKMKALTDFWEIYFKKSKAQVIEIGQPALLNPIH